MIFFCKIIFLAFYKLLLYFFFLIGDSNQLTEHSKKILV